MREISIVIITFNSVKFIAPCLDSIFLQSCQYQVIIVDNGSKDGTVEFLKKNYPKVTLIENRNNLGACKARNQGIVLSRAEWVLCLDCDIVLERGFLDKIIKLTENSNEHAGMFQPKILKFDKKTIYSCGIYLSKIRRFYDIGKNRLDSAQFDNLKHIFGVCSAAALYKKEMLEEIRDKNGYFDESFFFLVEDVDLSWRAQKKGWKAQLCPEIICYHNGNSSGSNSNLRRYLCFRNRLLSIFKNEKLINKIGLIPIFITYDFLRLLLILFNLANSNPRASKSK